MKLPTTGLDRLKHEIELRKKLLFVRTRRYNIAGHSVLMSGYGGGTEKVVL